MERYVIHVTKECNADCVYCYEDDKYSTYTWEEVKKVIDDIIKYRTSNDFGIEFLGGEPLLRWDLIKESYEYLESMNDIEVNDYIITTNGTIMNEVIADYLSKNKKIKFAASLDGHVYANQLRLFKESRKNTYDKVIENVKFLKKYNVECSIHMVTHPYNVAMISDSIDHLYKQGIRNIDIGTVEKTIKIDKEYCDRFIKELDIVSNRMVKGEYKDLNIGLFNWLKPKEDVRSYIRDSKTGKVIAESYGRSGKDITHLNNEEYDIVRCDKENEISNMIYNIRKAVYDNHQNNVKNIKKTF